MITILEAGSVYMYGQVDGPMTEATPFRPVSRKGEIRAEIAALLLNEMEAGSLTALIARAADFYGPRARTGVPNVLVFDRLVAGKKAMLSNTTIRELYEMLYQYEADCIFDSTKFVATFRVSPTTYAEGIRISARAGRA